ncbi:MAG: ABC transporter ATP-binding protein [Candidatus Brocadia sp. WS118]|nr:MAG: ABC transporter ATP-binding protein [Candidatus Brocadia sp. WS118]
MKAQLREKEFKQKRALWPFMKQLFGYSLRYKKWYVPFVSAILIVAVIDAIYPLVWLNYIDGVITPLVSQYKEAAVKGLSPELSYKGLFIFAIIYVVLAVLQTASESVFVYFSGKIREYVVSDLRSDMFRKLQYLSFSFYDRQALGWLISRITSDAGRVTELISFGFLSLVWGVFMIIACLVAMTLYSWILTLIVLATIPFLFLLSVKLRMLVLQYAREARKTYSEMLATFNEHIHGVEVNKISVQEDSAAANFSKISGKMEWVSFRSSYYSAMYSPLVVMVGSVAAALVIYLGGKMAIAGGITLGVLAAFFGYARIIYEPIMDITRFYALAQNSLSAGERIFSLIKEPITIYDREGVTDFGEIKGNIEFEGVRFHYVAEKPILKGLNLRINAGESIALVGPSGEGKTTITSLICRFYEPTGGAIKIDGVDYKEKTLESFRNQLGIILQTPHVFSGTIIENIRYADQNASEERIVEILNSIGAKEMVTRLAEEVGEEGSNLSLGEKQLISFARVILKNPKILIMDEATSSVDTLAEAKIQKGIAQLIKGRTSIIIAHRLSTIKHCDRILVIKKGEVVEEGKHEELIAKRRFYYDLYTKQSREGVGFAV